MIGLGGQQSSYLVLVSGVLLVLTYFLSGGFVKLSHNLDSVFLPKTVETEAMKY